MQPPETRDVVLEVRRLQKRFGAKLAVRDVSLSVRTGEIVGFLGPNGAGKTTVMSIVTGLFQPDDGEVKLFGQAKGAADPALRTRLAFLQEKPRVYPEMSGRGYLSFFADLYGVSGAAHKVQNLLDQFSLNHAADRPSGTYSRGMQQRLCLARIMLHDPEFIILDEPTLGLDPAGVRDIRETILKMNRGGVAFLFSSHQLAEMERICDRIILMNAGQVVAEGPRETVTASLQAYSTLLIEVDHVPTDLVSTLTAHNRITSCDILGPTQLKLGLAEGLDGEGRHAMRIEVSKIAALAGAAVLSVTLGTPTLEEAFLKLTSSTRH
jgi:ABC-type multidrug transport system ATPase subunit